MGAHVICESRLELARLLLADFDSGVTAIAAQPFLLQARLDGRARRHVPDFLLVHADGAMRVVISTRERTVRIAGLEEPRSSGRRGPLTGVLSPLASLKPSTELLSKPEKSRWKQTNLRSRK